MFGEELMRDVRLWMKKVYNNYVQKQNVMKIDQQLKM